VKIAPGPPTLKSGSASSNRNGPMMPCLEMATQAVHFTEYNGLYRQCSGGVLPQKILFLEFT